MQSALTFAKRHMSPAVEEEMCYTFSSEFRDVNMSELSTFVAVMRMLKLEYTESDPELYRIIITVLHDYDPSLGQAHRKIIYRHLEVLLQRNPEIADYLISVLPPCTAPSGEHPLKTHALHKVRVEKAPPGDTYNRHPSEASEKMDCDLKPREISDSNKPAMTSTGINTQPLQPFPSDTKVQHPCEQADGEEKRDLRFYNFTTPAVNAFLAKKGVPQKILPLTKTGTCVKIGDKEFKVATLGQLTAKDSKTPDTKPSYTKPASEQSLRDTRRVGFTTSGTGIQVSGVGVLGALSRPGSAAPGSMYVQAKKILTLGSPMKLIHAASGVKVIAPNARVVTAGARVITPDAKVITPGSRVTATATAESSRPSPRVQVVTSNPTLISSSLRVISPGVGMISPGATKAPGNITLSRGAGPRIHLQKRHPTTIRVRPGAHSGLIQIRPKACIPTKPLRFVTTSITSKSTLSPLVTIKQCLGPSAAQAKRPKSSESMTPSTVLPEHSKHDGNNVTSIHISDEGSSSTEASTSRLG